METNRLKRFATEARNILMQGVAHRFTALGFRPDGTPVEEPQLLGGGATFMGDTVTEDFYHKWQSLAAAIRRHGLKDVVEEAAYTWFNRLMAIRIMTKNGLIPPVLQYESPGVYVPLIVSEARQGRLPQMGEEERSRLMPLLDDDSRTAEQFSLLIVAFCHATPILHRCFGHIADYTELLLPANILAEGGFVDLINHTDFIAEEDYRSSELIGWLYQFYIAEKKDEVFAAKGKFTASEIPAATQIFTPNWIVKYMVQNTVGRIYLDNNPYETEVAQDWKYLVNPSEPTPDDRTLRYGDLTELRLADLACGSGHILGEMFDMLYTIYINEGYSRREAIEHIFRRNLTGIDLDTRAKQLAQFALLLKACQRDASFADCHCMPRVLDMPKAGLPLPADTHLATEIEAINQVLADAETLGSIMKFHLSPAAREWVASLAEENEAAQLVLALTERYHALVMNPPYMGGGNMNAVLSNYVKKNYEAGKADLATVFVERMSQMLVENGRYSFIIPPSWMFLSTFESLRKQIIEHETIDSLLHLSRGVFGADFGASSAVIIHGESQESYGTYFRLVERTFQEFDQKHLRMLFEQTLTNPDFKYNFKEYNKDVTSLPYSEEGNRIYYPHVSQQNFKKIPGCPIGYWVSEKMIEAFKEENLISSKSIARSGFSTGNNEKFIRLWHEVSVKRIGFQLSNNSEYLQSGYKYIPFTKGGTFRRWYGNNDSIVDWSTPEDMHRPRTTYMDKYYRPAITWNAITSGSFSCRYYDKGFLFEHAAVSLFVNEGYHYENFLAYLNSKVFLHYLKILNPTLNNGAEVVSSVPILETKDNNTVSLVHKNISISQSDWDAHETSWDFEENELVRLGKEVQHSCCTNANTSTNTNTNPCEPSMSNARQECRASYLDKKQWVDIKYTNRLPHWRQDGKTQFITFRLADSLPQAKLHELSQTKDEWLKAHPQPWDEKTKNEYNQFISERIDKWLDAGYGSCALKAPDIRRIVTDAFLHFNNERYVLLALVVMPNHVHALLTPTEGHDVVATIGRIKGFAASRINKMINADGEFWQRDCFDRIIRNEMDFEAKLDYIINNPANLPQDAYTLIVGGEEVQHSCCTAISQKTDNKEDTRSTIVRQECRTSCRLADLMEAYKAHWTEQFLQLHANEEELNRQFIGIYGLEDELTPDVPPEEITILQQGELTFNEKQ